MTMRIVIAGSREFTDYDVAKEFIDECIASLDDNSSFIFMSGGCRGADEIGERYAKEHGYPVVRYPADWKRYGRKAGPIRNRQMAQLADAVICFWDGKGRGTKSMLDCANCAGKTVLVKKI